MIPAVETSPDRADRRRAAKTLVQKRKALIERLASIIGARSLPFLMQGRGKDVPLREVCSGLSDAQLAEVIASAQHAAEARLARFLRVPPG